MFKQLERQSLLEKKSIQHPYIPCVYIHDKDYFCLEHLELKPLNRGSMRQHIQGKKHRLNFDTGEPLVKTKNQPIDVEEHAKEWVNQKSSKKEVTESDLLIQLAIKLGVIYLQQDPVIARLLAKHGLEGELRDDVMQTLLIRDQWRVLKEANKAK